MEGSASSGNSASKVDPITWVIFPVAGMDERPRREGIVPAAARRTACALASAGPRIVAIRDRASSEGRSGDGTVAAIDLLAATPARPGGAVGVRAFAVTRL